MTIVTILYAILPGHPDLPVRGLPLRPFELAGLVAVVALCLANRPQAGRPRISSTPVMVLAIATLVKGLLAFAWYPAGWLTCYYANQAFEPPIERSTDFLPWPLSREWGDDATRIDRVIDFRGTSFPIHFLNDSRFAHGARREFTDPFSVEWQGTFETPVKLTLTPILEARGAAELLLDGHSTLAVDSPVVDEGRRAELTIAPGRHVFTVRYRKPAQTDGFIRLSRFDDGSTQVLTDPKVLPFPVAAWRRAVRGLLPAAAWMAHGAALLALLSWLGPLMRDRADITSLRQAGGLRGLQLLVVPATVAGLLTQGVLQARPLVDRVMTLAASDEAFALEAQARQIEASGPTDSAGAPGYFLAAVHWVTGESFAGVILITFVLFAVAAVAIYRLTETLLGPRSALLALGSTLALQQIALVRDGPIASLPENLYFSAAAVTALALTRIIRSRSRGWKTLP